MQLCLVPQFFFDYIRELSYSYVLIVALLRISSQEKRIWAIRVKKIKVKENN
jgi:hypothetical protein